MSGFRSAAAFLKSRRDAKSIVRPDISSLHRCAIASIEHHSVSRCSNSVKKSELPTKLCPVCQRPFAWRKKWERNWEEVTYCSERCRRNRSSRLATDD